MASKNNLSLQWLQLLSVLRKQEGKDQEYIPSNTTPDLGNYMEKCENTNKQHIQESQALSSRWSEGCIEKTRRSVKIIQDGLNMFDGTNLTLISDVDDDDDDELEFNDASTLLGH